MHIIHDLQDGGPMRSIKDLIVGRPTSWQGLSIEWLSGEQPVPVFLKKFVLRTDNQSEELYILGARYELSEALVSGESLGNGYFVEYFVVKVGPNGILSLHRLLQRESVTFSETDEKQDYVPALEINDPVGLSIYGSPVWEPTQAVWPTLGGVPMRFVGQIELPETSTTRMLLTWGVTLYLFWLSSNGADHFKLVMQEFDAQPIEE